MRDVPTETHNRARDAAHTYIPGPLTLDDSPPTANAKVRRGGPVLVGKYPGFIGQEQHKRSLAVAKVEGRDTSPVVGRDDTGGVKKTGDGGHCDTGGGRKTTT